MMNENTDEMQNNTPGEGNDEERKEAGAETAGGEGSE